MTIDVRFEGKDERGEEISTPRCTIRTRERERGRGRAVREMEGSVFSSRNLSVNRSIVGENEESGRVGRMDWEI